ncbi:MAG TPA: hypothetical protein DD435_14595 [Cyanobacteria bacterium UBA8530]|nr:hypothetical protein [Cyanobacteria bacterium UBA8530]
MPEFSMPFQLPAIPPQYQLAVWIFLWSALGLWFLGRMIKVFAAQMKECPTCKKFAQRKARRCPHCSGFF